MLKNKMATFPSENFWSGIAPAAAYEKDTRPQNLCT